jgi:hypothetical protein
MGLPRWRRFAATFSLFLSLAACAENASWTTPIAPARAGREADCPVALTTAGASPGTETLAIQRCNYVGNGETCHELGRRAACAVGGNVIYGLHWESRGSGRSYSSTLVGTIGFDPARASTP